MPDLEISKLPELSGASLQAADPIALADLSAGDTKKITAKELIQHGVALIDDGAIPSSKVNATLAPGSIDTVHLADDAVTAAKLADNSSAVLGAVLPTRGEFIGQLAMHAGNGKLYAWDGSIWQAPKAAGSLNNLSGTAGVIQVTAVTTGDAATISATATPSTGGGQVLAGPALSGGAIAPRSLVSSDIPTATTSAKGAVAVGGTGLTLSGDKVVIDNSVTPSATARLVTYTAQGLVTGGKAIEPADLPLAGSSSAGAVRPGTGLVVGSGGDLNHSNVVAGGTATKVTFDNTGHITGTAPLADSDIPNHSASKLTSGTLSPTVLGDRSIPQTALGNYTIAYIQESTPGTTGAAAHIGMLWFQESTGALRMWNGNSWFSVGLGRLAQDNLRWGGLFNATTGHVTGLTDFGTQAGLVVGTLVPSAVDALGGLYLVCETGGTGVTVTSGVTYDTGDWLLCINQTAGWKRLDTLSSGGGGGGSGAAKIDDLLDVTIVSPQNAQALVYDGNTNQWKNSSVSLGTVTSVGSGAGLEGGPITSTGTLNVKADAGISVSSSGVAVNRTTLDGWYAAATHVGAGAAAHAVASTTVAGFMSAADKTTINALATTYLTQASAATTYAPLASPALTGTPSAPTATKGTSTTQLATTAFVAAATPAATEATAGVVELATAAETTTGTDALRAVTPAGLKVELDKKAALDSPALTGTPTAPTAITGTDTAQLATTAFVAAATPAATDTGRGLVELATAAEVTSGTDTARAVTPAGLKVELDKKANQATTYTKTEVNTSLAAKADQTSVNTALALKADQATTYTKTEIDNAFTTYLPKNIASLPSLP